MKTSAEFSRLPTELWFFRKRRRFIDYETDFKKKAYVGLFF